VKVGFKPTTQEQRISLLRNEKATIVKKPYRKASIIENINLNESNQEDVIKFNDSKRIISGIDLEYSKLQKINVTNENICYVCELGNNAIQCNGNCQRYYHLSCGDLEKKTLNNRFECKDCRSKMHACFECKNTSNIENRTKKCSFNTCGRYFHDECTKTNKLFRFDNSDPSNNSFFCPSHTCVTCWIHNLNESIDQTYSKTHMPIKETLLTCTKCTNAYHASEYCVPAGSVVSSSGSNLQCPNHCIPLRKVTPITKFVFFFFYLLK